MIPWRHSVAEAGFLLLFATALIGTSGCASDDGVAGAHRASVPVTVRPLQRILRADGVLEASEFQDVMAPFEATVESLAPEGSMVEPGDVIARLDNREKLRELREKEKEKEHAILDKELKDLELDLETFELRNRLAFGKHDLEVLRIEQRLAEEGVDPAEYVRIKRTQEEVEKRRTTLERTLEARRPGVSKGHVTADEIASLELELARLELEATMLSLEEKKLLRGAGPGKVATARMKTHKSTSAIALIEAQLAGLEKRHAENRRELEVRLETLDEEIQVLRSTSRKAVLTASLEGIVLYAQIPRQFDSEKLKEGIRLDEGTNFMKIARPGRLELELDVPWRVAPRLSPGQEVRFFLPAYPDRAYKGTLTEVGLSLGGGQFGRWLYPDVWVLRARASVEDTDPLLRPGMSAIVQIVTDRQRECLTLPAAAVAGQQVVLAGDGSRRTIETGASEAGFVEVLQGLEAGERVLMPPQGGGEPRLGRKVVVRQGDIHVTVRDAATLDPVQTHDLFLDDLEGESRILWIAEEGLAVEKGDVVARLDPQNVQEKLRQKNLELDKALKDREVQESQSSAEKEKLLRELEVARFQLDVAVKEESELRSGLTTRLRLDRKLGVELAEVSARTRGNKVRILEDLGERGFSSWDELRKESDAHEKALTTLEVARAKLKLALDGATPSELTRARNKVEKARLDLALARRKLDIEEERIKKKMSKLTKQTDTARSEVQRHEAMLASLTVTAPVTGVVVLIENWTNEGPQKTKVGDPIREGMTFAQIADTSSYRLLGALEEDKIRGIEPGQPVEFWLGSAPETRYDASIDSISTVASLQGNRWFGGERRVFEILLSTEAASRRFQPGMSVIYEVRLATEEDRLIVPLASIFMDAQGPYVIDGDHKKRRVELGPASDEEVAVLSGLEAGEEVYLGAEAGSGG